MSYKPAIKVTHLDKCYQLYAQPKDRLKQFLWRGKRQFFKEFWALRNINFEITPGEVIGIIGRNGAGKSSLLQLICGTLTPSRGEVTVNGRIAALLELGAGFNPEFSGRENIFMSASIMGLSDADIIERFDDIIEFSGISDFIDQPVKTYSSGMYIRLAFSVAINVDPDILVVDEALSVGDGAFARQSFDRIMDLKNSGKTILFCSHSLYQVEAICNRAIWLENGEIKMIGAVENVTMSYQNSLLNQNKSTIQLTTPHLPENIAKIVSVTVSNEEISGKIIPIHSLKSDLLIQVEIVSTVNLPIPNIAIAITTIDSRGVTMVGSQFDNISLDRDKKGKSIAKVVFNKIPLARGDYWVDVYLGCENSIHIYDTALQVAKLTVSQDGMEQGVVKLPHHWLEN
ncbi:MAG: ATP-binding cassette domain-containing protein [Methyloprofundus sp.]|nr:ATP-binding cassette domain-containing protein [Methyloprofundus sp.]